MSRKIVLLCVCKNVLGSFGRFLKSGICFCIYNNSRKATWVILFLIAYARNWLGMSAFVVKLFSKFSGIRDSNSVEIILGKVKSLFTVIVCKGCLEILAGLGISCSIVNKSFVVSLEWGLLWTLVLGYLIVELLDNIALFF